MYRWSTFSCSGMYMAMSPFLAIWPWLSKGKRKESTKKTQWNRLGSRYGARAKPSRPCRSPPERSRANDRRKLGCDQSASAGGRRFSAGRRWAAVSPARSPWRSPRGSAAEQRQSESFVSFFSSSHQLLATTPLSKTRQLARNHGAPVNRNALHAFEDFLEKRSEERRVGKECRSRW